MSDNSESPSEVDVNHFLSELNSTVADDDKNDMNLDDMDSSVDATISTIPLCDEMCSDEAQTTIHSADISVKSDIGIKSFRRNRFKRSKIGKQKKWRASVYSQRLKPSEIGGEKRRKRSKINTPRFHVMQHYRECFQERTEEELNSQKNRAVNEFILDTVMKLKMEKEALFQQVIRLKGKAKTNQ